MDVHTYVRIYMDTRGSIDVATNVAWRKITDARCIEDMFIWAQTSYASDTQACR